MFVDTYTHPLISEVTLKDEKDEHILIIDDGGRFKGVQYSKNNEKNPSTTSEEPKKKESLPMQPPPKELAKKDPPKKGNTKKDSPKGEPKKKTKDKGVELDIDVGAAIGKMTAQVPIKELSKHPSQRWQIKNAFGFEEKDPPITLQNIHLFNTNPGHEPFLHTLAINNNLLHNLMLDSRDSANIILLKVMKKFNLNITRKYKNVCRFDSKSIEVEGLIMDLKVSLAINPDISLLMDVMVIDIPDI